ncbi:hypothetical protein HDV05_000191 [Chytridiales sp. JEL 0842]|nr:hypothetical protein HDV05_000191 [Chytridiales sp. JEL 0842]
MDPSIPGPIPTDLINIDPNWPISGGSGGSGGSDSPSSGGSENGSGLPSSGGSESDDGIADIGLPSSGGSSGLPSSGGSDGGRADTEVRPPFNGGNSNFLPPGTLPSSGGSEAGRADNGLPSSGGTDGERADNGGGFPDFPGGLPSSGGADAGRADNTVPDEVPRRVIPMPASTPTLPNDSNRLIFGTTSLPLQPSSTAFTVVSPTAAPVPIPPTIPLATQQQQQQQAATPAQQDQQPAPNSPNSGVPQPLPPSRQPPSAPNSPLPPQQPLPPTSNNPITSTSGSSSPSSATQILIGVFASVGFAVLVTLGILISRRRSPTPTKNDKEGDYSTDLQPLPPPLILRNHERPTHLKRMYKPRQSPALPSYSSPQLPPTSPSSTLSTLSTRKEDFYIEALQDLHQPSDRDVEGLEEFILPTSSLSSSSSFDDEHEQPGWTRSSVSTVRLSSALTEISTPPTSYSLKGGHRRTRSISSTLDLSLHPLSTTTPSSQSPKVYLSSPLTLQRPSMESETTERLSIFSSSSLSMSSSSSDTPSSQISLTASTPLTKANDELASPPPPPLPDLDWSFESIDGFDSRNPSPTPRSSLKPSLIRNQRISRTVSFQTTVSYSRNSSDRSSTASSEGFYWEAQQGSGMEFVDEVNEEAEI